MPTIGPAELVVVLVIALLIRSSVPSACPTRAAPWAGGSASSRTPSPLRATPAPPTRTSRGSTQRSRAPKPGRTFEHGFIAGLEILGLVAFAVSGALLAIRRE